MANIIITHRTQLNAAVVTESLPGLLYAGENDAHVFIISAVRGDTPVTLSGAVTGLFIRPDESTVALDGEIVGGCASVTLPQSCYTQTGRFQLTVYVTENNVKTAVYCLTGNVKKTTTETIIDPGHVVPDISDIIAEYATMQQAVEDCEDAAEAANTAATAAEAAAANVAGAIADAYSATSTYAVGDYCTKDGKLYRCVSAISTAEAWTAAHWTEVQAMEEVGDVKSETSATADELTGLALTDTFSYAFSYNPGYYGANGSITSPGATTKEVYTNRIKVSPDKWLSVTLSHSEFHGAMWFGYARYDASGTFLSRQTFSISSVASSYSTQFYVAEGTEYISFTFRTYDDFVFSCSLESTTTENKDTIATIQTDLTNTGKRINFKTTDLAAGVINGDGTIGTQSTAYRQVYTQDYIPVSCEMTCSAHVVFNRSLTIWGAIALYDGDKAIVGRPTILNNVTGTDLIGQVEITDERVKFARLTFYTYDSLVSASLSLANTGDIYYRKKNLFPLATTSSGYIDSPAGTVNTNHAYTNNMVSDAIPVTAGKNYTILLSFNGDTGITPGIRYCWYDSNGTKLADPTNISFDAAIRYTSFEKAVFVTAPTGAASIRIAAPMYNRAWISFYEGNCYAPYTPNERDFVEAAAMFRYPTYKTGKHFVKAIAHRGGGPENTLPAYILSKRRGFEYGECDIAFTADGVPVLLHDASINRTARNADGTAISGTVNIADITYEQALTYDFGIYASARFAGTKIPTFEQFIACCKNISMHPYIELKAGDYTDAVVESLVNTVKQYGMLRNVTWIASSIAKLTKVLANDPKARVGYVVSALSADIIAAAQGLKTDENEVFLDAEYSDHSSYSLAIEAGIPLEIWTMNTTTSITGMNPYVTGVTSDNLVAWQVLGKDLFEQYQF